MDATAYCDTLEKHLTGWKAKLYDVIRIVDHLPENDKETVFSSIRGLHAIVDQIDAEVERSLVDGSSESTINKCFNTMTLRNLNQVSEI